jgi:hypothetical protein
LAVPASVRPEPTLLTVPSQGCRMAEKKGHQAPELEEDADG